MATAANRNVATPHAVACLFPCLLACANTAIEAVAASATTKRNSPKERSSSLIAPEALKAPTRRRRPSGARALPVLRLKRPVERRSHSPSALRPLGDRAEEFLDLECRQSLQLRAPARAERNRDLGDRGRIRRFDDVHEVERPERCPLMDDLGAELLDVAVDLAEPLG